MLSPHPIVFFQFCLESVWSLFSVFVLFSFCPRKESESDRHVDESGIRSVRPKEVTPAKPVGRKNPPQRAHPRQGMDVGRGDLAGLGLQDLPDLHKGKFVNARIPATITRYSES